MKRTTLKLLFVLMCFLAVFHKTVNAQDSTKKEKYLKNTIHINITNPIIFGTRNIILGYERNVNKRQTFSVNFGVASLPSLGIITSDSLQAKGKTDDKGFNFSVDYRFYLSKENKYDAPRGIYIGPYYSYNYFGKTHLWELKSTNGGAPVDVETETSIRFNTVGFELGYQFVFWNRLSLDLVLIGPGIATYNLKASINTSNLSEADKVKFYEKLNEALSEKFPGYSWAVDESEFRSNGSTNTTSLGYRYVVQLGFRF